MKQTLLWGILLMSLFSQNSLAANYQTNVSSISANVPSVVNVTIGSFLISPISNISDNSTVTNINFYVIGMPAPVSFYPSHIDNLTNNTSIYMNISVPPTIFPTSYSGQILITSNVPTQFINITILVTALQYWDIYYDNTSIEINESSAGIVPRNIVIQNFGNLRLNINVASNNSAFVFQNILSVPPQTNQSFFIVYNTYNSIPGKLRQDVIFYTDSSPINRTISLNFNIKDTTKPVISEFNIPSSVYVNKSYVISSQLSDNGNISKVTLSMSNQYGDVVTKNYNSSFSDNFTLQYGHWIANLLVVDGYRNNESITKEFDVDLYNNIELLNNINYGIRKINSIAIEKVAFVNSTLTLRFKLLNFTFEPYSNITTYKVEIFSTSVNPISINVGNDSIEMLVKSGDSVFLQINTSSYINFNGILEVTSPNDQKVIDNKILFYGKFASYSLPHSGTSTLLGNNISCEIKEDVNIEKSTYPCTIIYQWPLPNDFNEITFPMSFNYLNAYEDGYRYKVNNLQSNLNDTNSKLLLFEVSTFILIIGLIYYVKVNPILRMRLVR